MKKYILVGLKPVQEWGKTEPDYAEIAKYIDLGWGNIHEISSLDELDNLLDQLRDWDNFAVITAEDAASIWKELAKLFNIKQKSNSCYVAIKQTKK